MQEGLGHKRGGKKETNGRGWLINCRYCGSDARAENFKQTLPVCGSNCCCSLQVILRIIFETWVETVDSVLLFRRSSFPYLQMAGVRLQSAFATVVLLGSK